MKRITTLLATISIAVVLASTGCTNSASTSRAESTGHGDSALTPAPATTAAPVSPGFVNRVWQVVDTTDVKTGMMYAFLSDGTLVMTSPNGTPALGTWKLSPSGLTMIEENVAYETEIVTLNPTEMELRSHNPGGTAEIRLVPADTPPYTP